jgi:hypothetical protein
MDIEKVRHSPYYQDQVAKDADTIYKDLSKSDWYPDKVMNRIRMVDTIQAALIMGICRSVDKEAWILLGDAYADSLKLSIQQTVSHHADNPR